MKVIEEFTALDLVFLWKIAKSIDFEFEFNFLT